MQTTLLALAVAVILALVAALVGPLVVDWSGYRALFESEASRLLGVDVRVNGQIDARLLPSPRLTLHRIELGNGRDAVRARSLGLEFSLGALMQGEWHATEVQFDAPQFQFSLDRDGVVHAPALALGFAPDALTINKLSVIDGKVTLTDAAGARSVTFDRLWFNGELGSLLGPVRGEGAAAVNDAVYPFRLTAGRYNSSGGLKLKVNVDPREYPVNIEVDGTLTLAGGKPQFEGSLSVRRPAGIAAHGTDVLTHPWHLRGKVKADHASALMNDLEFVYGAEDDGLKLAGAVDFSFGQQPLFKAVLSGRQVDVDRLAAGSEEAASSPGAALNRLAALAGKAFHPPVPIQLGISIDQVKLGGNVVQSLRGDVTTADGNWNLDRLEFRAPGFTQVRLSGRLAVAAESVRFSGPADLESKDPKALAAWLEGRKPPAQDELRPLHVHGDVTLGTEKFAIENLTAEFARKTIAGNFVYIFPADAKSSRLEAELNAPELDLDLALDFGRALFAGSRLERPQEMAIKADIGHARLAGIEGREIKAQVKVDADQWQIDQLSVAELGGAAFSAQGRVTFAGPAPQGRLRIDLNAPDLAPVTALLERFAPDAARMLQYNAHQMAPTELHAQLSLEGKAPSETRFSIDGNLGKVRIAVAGDGQLDAKQLRFGNLRVKGTLDADEGRVLVGVLGLDRVVSVARGPAKLSLSAAGPAYGEMRVESRLEAAGLEATIHGTAQPFAEMPAASLQATIVRADFAPLRGTGQPLPINFSGRVGVAGNKVAIQEINAVVAGTTARGNLNIEVAESRRLHGEIEADFINGPAVIAAAVGLPEDDERTTNKDASTGWKWSDHLFGGGAFGNYDGEIAVRARRVALLPQLNAREFSAKLRLGDDALAIEEAAGLVSGGRLSGALSLRSGPDGVTAHTSFSLKGADTATLIRAAARPAVTGTLDLSADVEATGLSPVALIGSLRGSGMIRISKGELAGLDPRAFDAVTRAVDQGVPVEPDRIADVVRKALAGGQLSVEQAEAAFAVNAGQVRLSELTTSSKDAKLSLSGNIDLLDGSLNARLVLSGADSRSGVRPDIFMALHGPFSDVSRTIDVSALTGWLTLRAIENQAQRVKELEEAARKRREAEERRLEEERQRQAAERQRQEEERKRREAAERQREEEERARRQAAQQRELPASPQSAEPPAPAGDGRFAPQEPPRSGSDSTSLPTTAPSRERRAPPLPAPIDIGPPPGVRGSDATGLPWLPRLFQPEASVGPQR